MPRARPISLPRRLAATLLDALIPLTLTALAGFVIIATDPEPPPTTPWNLFDQIVDYLQDRPLRTTAILLVALLLQLVWPLIFALHTPGRRALAITPLTRAATPPTLLRILAWSAARIPLLLFAGLGAWWALIDPERRTLYDRVAGLTFLDTRPAPPTKTPNIPKSL